MGDRDHSQQAPAFGYEFNVADTEHGCHGWSAGPIQNRSRVDSDWVVLKASFSLRILASRELEARLFERRRPGRVREVLRIKSGRQKDAMPKRYAVLYMELYSCLSQMVYVANLRMVP